MALAVDCSVISCVEIQKKNSDVFDEGRASNHPSKPLSLDPAETLDLSLRLGS